MNYEKSFNEKSFEKTVDKNAEQLPILEHKKSIMEILDNSETGIVIGETGSGKTTQIPLFLLEKLGKNEKIAVTQPRRVAARSVAKFVAGKSGCKIGEEVGFNVRFEDRTTEGTRLTFMTDGILLRKIQEDKLLSSYEVVVVDEAHERSLNIDFVLGLLKQIQVKRNEIGKPLKVVVTSATLEKEKFKQYFNSAPSIEVPGRLHPVEMHFEETTPVNVMEAASEKVKKIVSESDRGDILIFMPGKQEIEDTIGRIQKMKLANLEVLPLFGDMSPEDQDKIFNKLDKRKVVVATNIAETSVTVPGLKYVIDSGLIRQVEYDHNTGIESLLTKYHAKSGAKQRAGRAGRTEPGECYRLYTESDFNNKFQEYQTPEIVRSNLSHVVLMMKNIGIENVEDFDFIDPPEKQAFLSAIKTLKNLGALDETGKMTKIGEIMSDLPLEPHLGRMVLEAQNHGCVQEIATIAAFLNGRSVFMRPKDKEDEAEQIQSQFKDSESDFMSLLNVWNSYAQNGFKDSWAYKNFLNAKVLKEVESVRNQLLRSLKQNNIRATSLLNKEAIGKSLTSGLIENLFEHSRKYWYKGVIKESEDIKVFPGSSTRGNTFDWFVSEDIYTNAKGDTYARTIQKVKPEWIVEVAPNLVDKSIKGYSYDKSIDNVVQNIKYYLKSTRTELISKNEISEGREAEKTFAEYLANNDKILEFQGDNKEVINQLNVLFKKSLGKIQSTNLKSEYQKILEGSGVYSVAKLNEMLNSGNIDLRLMVENYADSNLLDSIIEGNPDKIVINGNEYHIEYEYNGYYESDKTNPDNFSAKISIPINELLNIPEIPKLPSGRTLKVLAVTETGYVKFDGLDISSLQKNAQEYTNQQIEEKRLLEEREKLSPVVIEQIKELESDWYQMKYSYSEYGLTYQERDQIDDAISYAKNYSNDNPSKSIKYINSIVGIVEKSKNYKELKEKSKTLVEESIKKYYDDLPDIDRDRVDFPFDEYGNEDESVVISQLFTNNGKLIAEHIYDGLNNESFINRPDEYGENVWQGEPFDSVVFKDLGRILTAEDSEERLQRIEDLKYEKDKQERIEQYENDLEYAEQQVEGKYWKEGKFKKVFNTKDNSEKWEMTIGGKGNRITYIVDGESIQPLDDRTNYFFSIEKNIVDFSGNKVFLVFIERPYPEDAPGYDENKHENESSEQEDPDIFEKLKNLQNKFSGR